MFRKKNVSFIYRVEDYVVKEASVKQIALDGGEMFLRNVGLTSRTVHNRRCESTKSYILKNIPSNLEERWDWWNRSGLPKLC
jgi:hypothetical protein